MDIVTQFRGFETMPFLSLLAQGQVLTPEFIDALTQAGVAVILAAAFLFLIIVGGPALIIWARSRSKGESEQNKTVQTLAESIVEQAKNTVALTQAIKDGQAAQTEAFAGLQEYLLKFTDVLGTLQNATRRAGDASTAAFETAGATQDAIASLTQTYTDRNTRLNDSFTEHAAKQEVHAAKQDEASMKIIAMIQRVLDALDALKAQPDCDQANLENMIQVLTDEVVRVLEEVKNNGKAA